MRNEKLKFLVLFVLFLGITKLHAQETIPSSGGNASGSGGTTSYTVGQVVYTINTGTNGSVIQGVQQPYEISVISGIDVEYILLECSAYPNPATDYLTLKVENKNNKSLFYQLYDMSGTLLKNEKLNENEVTISIEDFIPSIYFLKVTDSQKEIKTFKIIKN